MSDDGIDAAICAAVSRKRIGVEGRRALRALRAWGSIESIDGRGLIFTTPHSRKRARVQRARDGFPPRRPLAMAFTRAMAPGNTITWDEWDRLMETAQRVLPSECA